MSFSHRSSQVGYAFHAFPKCQTRAHMGYSGQNWGGGIELTVPKRQGLNTIPRHVFGEPEETKVRVKKNAISCAEEF